MRDQITGRLQSLLRSFGSFTAGQKTIAVIGALALALGGAFVFRWASTPTYAPLFTNMAPADASAVVDKLASAGTPYQLTDGGGTVLVPQNDVYSARISLSGQGLPSQSSDGYGLLDKQSLSTSQFQEQTTYKRAIEGELDKTIEALDAVDAAVVHVAMPQQALFSSEKAPTTASVLVQAHPGSTLSSGQVQAIVHLVASSVEGLDPAQVTVTDSAGNVLSTAGQGVDVGGDSRAQQVEGFEDDMTGSVTDMLTRIVGPNNSAVTVNADLNFDKTTTQSVRYFTNTAVKKPLTTSRATEKYTGGAGVPGGAQGVVGPDGQLTTTGTGTNGSASKYDKRQETSDNAIDKTVEQKEAAPGNVRALHVGIVLDTQALGASTPQQVQALVSAAMGIDPKRGDTLSVTTMPFNRTAETAAAAELKAATAADAKAAMITEAKTGGLVGVVLLALLVAWFRGRKRRKMRDEATKYVVEQLRRPEPPAPALPPGPSPAELEAPDSAQLRLAARDEIAAMVERQPEEVAQLLRGWLVESDH